MAFAKHPGWATCTPNGEVPPYPARYDVWPLGWSRKANFARRDLAFRCDPASVIKAISEIALADVYNAPRQMLRDALFNI